MKKWWIGCSGFYYKSWRDQFYPAGLPQRKWFEYYCEHFNTVELNVSFYRLPKPDVLKGWYNRSPAGFRFAVKAPRLITHFRRFHNVAEDVRSLYDLFNTGLSEKLGCVLFQLHPQMVYTDENLVRILSVLDPSYRNIVEFRHASWWCEPVVKALKEHNVTFCSISYPGLPDAVIKSARVIYYRFHGVPKMYLSSYSNKKLAQICESLQTTRGVREVYAYFNNDIEVAAVYNARKLQELAGYRSPEI